MSAIIDPTEEPEPRPPWTEEGPSWNTLLPTVEDCLTLMERKWASYENAVSGRFRLQWKQLFEAYRQQIIDFDAPEKRDALTVLSPCTGSGKSLSCLVFSALLCLCPTQPGGRVVVRTMAAANKLAEDINTLTEEMGYTGGPFAIAWHSREKKRKIGKAAKLEALAHLSKVPLIVTCHRGLEISLGHLAMTGQESEEAEALANFEGKPRRFFCIDECANFIQVATVEKKTIKLIVANLPDRLEAKYASTIQWLQEAIRREDPEKDSVCLEAAEPEPGKLPKLLELRHDMRFLRLTKRDHAIFEEALTMLHSFVRTWIRFKKRFDEGVMLSTSRSLLGPEARGAIVLDATATISRQLYELFGKRTQMIAPIEGLRTYRPVVVHLARGHNVGKNTMVKQPKKMQAIAHELLKNLPTLPEAGPDGPRGKGLLIAHEAMKLTIGPLLPPGWETTHWGLHDGSNDWADCDVVVIFGLPLLPEEYGTYIYDGYSPPDEPPLHTEEEREAIQETLKRDACGVAVIQGASRGSCRRVIGVAQEGEDAGAGFCPKMDIYMLMPEDELGAVVIEALKKALPNHSEEVWDYGGKITRNKKREEAERKKMEPKLKPEPKDAEGIPKVLAYLLAMKPGPEHRIYRKELEEACGVNRRTAQRVTTLLHTDRPAALYLEKAGVFTRNDETDNRAYFEKREA